MTLPDGSIVSYDIYSSITDKQGEAQRYIPSTGQWIKTGTVPVQLSCTSCGSELGPAFLLPDGRAWFTGANGNTAFYTPPATQTTPPGAGTWTTGPTLPNGLTAGDAPGAVLPNGDVLIAVAPEIYPNPNAAQPGQSKYIYPSPTTLYEFDPTNNTFTNVTPSPFNAQNQLTNFNLDLPTYKTTMLVLPTGQVLLANDTGQMDIYTPSGSPNAAWKPTVSNIAYVSGSTFSLTGTTLDGIDEGAAYGDDQQMATNYPIVELTSTSGQVTFAKTTNWSPSVDPGVTSSADFTLPAQDGPGVYTLSVIANGIASSPVMFVAGTSGNDTVTVDTSVLPFFGIPLVTVNLDGTTTGLFQSTVSGIFVATENGNDTVSIDHTVAGIPVSVSLGSGTDTVHVSPATASLDAIAGAVTVNGSGTTQLFIDDQQDNENAVIPGLVTDVLTGTTLTRSATGVLLLNGPSVDRVTTINYGGLADLTLYAGAMPNVINVEGTSAPTTVSAGAGNQQVTVSPSAESLDTIAGPLTVNGGGAHAARHRRPERRHEST